MTWANAADTQQQARSSGKRKRQRQQQQDSPEAPSEPPAAAAADGAFWKPGEAQPPAETTAKQNKSDHNANNSNRNSDSKHPKKSRKRGREEAEDEADFAPPKPAADPNFKPSSTLLSMKFMSRKANSVAAEQQAAAKKRKLDEGFDTALTRAILETHGEDTDITNTLICQTHERTPEEVILGRRAFGKFNAGIELAYNQSVQNVLSLDSKSNEPRQVSASDMRMLERLQKHVGMPGQRAQALADSSGLVFSVGTTTTKDTQDGVLNKGKKARKKKAKKFPNAPPEVCSVPQLP
jgi:hypothetical protein